MSRNSELVIIRILLSLVIGLSSLFGIINGHSIYSLEILGFVDYTVKIIILSAVLFCSVLVIVLSFISYNKVVWSILFLLWLIVLFLIVFLDFININFRNLDFSTIILYIVASINYILYTHIIISMFPKRKA